MCTHFSFLALHLVLWGVEDWETREIKYNLQEGTKGSIVLSKAAGPANISFRPNIIPTPIN